MTESEASWALEPLQNLCMKWLLEIQQNNKEVQNR